MIYIRSTSRRLRERRRFQRKGQNFVLGKGNRCGNGSSMKADTSGLFRG